MLNIDFTNDAPNNHTCIGHQEGDWIIFSCCQCNYLRKMNWKTGEMHTQPGDESVTHSGQHVPMKAHVPQASMN